jgi:DNA-binding MarR family transcriptional regulator
LQYQPLHHLIANSKPCTAANDSGADGLKRRKIKADTPPRARAAIDFGPLADWVGFHLRMAQIASFQAFARQAKEAGTRPGRFAALMLIRMNPGISQTALSQASGRDKSTLTPLLVDLVRKGLVRRVRSPGDKRSYRLSLTAAGEHVLARLTEGARRHEQNLDRAIGARHRTMFLNTLRRIMHEVV